ncbi:MAG: helix-hairpin-helix domain-containing protein [Planctomycetes bacterium]|nr:helix-hairpin-helix domain-containing protein [Planctomycetota bacterium]MBI3834666.1 helix-hairpin-helix domain-containing protein [Planctomycetota bacterium]
MILVWLIALPALIPQGFHAIWPSHESAASALPIPLQQTLDPNVAPWYELSALPRIGDSLAKRIIEFRNTACANGAERAFENLADLQQVRGIGPKTAAKLAPFIRFEARCAGAIKENQGR